jgi:RHS repeat-associated protein
MTDPYDGEKFTSTSASVLFRGYTQTKSEQIQVRARNASGSWVTIASAVTSTSPTSWNGGTYYAWSVSKSLPFPSYWRAEGNAGHRARVRAVGATSGDLYAFDEDVWSSSSQCYLLDEVAMEPCVADTSPIITIATTAFTTCNGLDNTCNSRDEDCDGSFDESYSVTTTCGEGVCQRTGTKICVAGQILTQCTQGTPSTESCNGLDDDCDGEVDEGLSSATTCGQGVCARTGVLTCVGGSPIDTCTPGDPTGIDVTCDGADDDCDGSADEAFVDLNPCATDTCVSGVLDSTPIPGLCPSAPTAPPVPIGAQLPFFESVEHLLDAYQDAPTPSAIDPARVVRLYGEVRAINGAPIGGVRVAVLEQEEQLGHVFTRADGRWDYVANGGRTLHVRFNEDGHPEVQRTITPGVREHVYVRPVVMTPYDTANTSVTFGSSSVQVHHASTVTDVDGTRHAMLLIPAGVTATADGTPVSTAVVRATEYTVGARGPAAMPGTMPPQIAYTYASEFSLHANASAPAASFVQFSSPVFLYLENFLSNESGERFPPGSRVPTGFYDRVTGRWVATNDGVVLRILGYVGGTAQVSISADNTPASATQLAPLGVTPAELVALAAQQARYPVGTTLWRVPLSHFSPYDCNWPYDIAAGATLPDAPTPDLASQRSCDGGGPSIRRGTLIHCENQSVAEEFPVAGTGMTLRYQSDRVLDFEAARRLRFPIRSTLPPAEADDIRVSVDVAGRHFEELLPTTTPTSFYEFDGWDGLDWTGQPARGPVPATIEVCHRYPATGFNPSGPGFTISGLATQAAERTFGDWGIASGSSIALDREEMRAELCTRTQTTLEVFDSQHLHQLGGLALSARHVTASGGLYLGSGAHVQVGAALRGRVTTVAGNATASPGVIANTNAVALNTRILAVTGVTTDPEGQIVFSTLETAVSSDTFVSGVFRVLTNGTLQRIAGGVPAGPSTAFASGVSAANNPLHPVGRPVFGPDGSLYFIEVRSLTARVARVSTTGVITTFAGGALAAPTALDEVIAAGSRVYPRDISFGPDGLMYFIEASQNRIRYVDSQGRLATAAVGLTGTPEHLTFWQDRLVFGAHVSDSASLFEVRADGTVLELTSTAGSTAVPTDGQSLASFRPRAKVVGLTALGDRLYFETAHWDADDRHTGLWMTTGDAVVRLAGARSGASRPFDAVPLSSTGLYDGDPLYTMAVSSLAVTSTGLVRCQNSDVAGNVCATVADCASDEVCRDGRCHRGVGYVERIELTEGAPVVSPDGSSLFYFDELGRHTQTRSRLTNELILSFVYGASNGRLSEVRDGNDNVVLTATYGTNTIDLVRPAPFTGLTRIQLNGSGWATNVRHPNDPTTSTGLSFAYSGTRGALDYIDDSRGYRHDITLDSLGRVQHDVLRSGATELARWNLGGTRTQTDGGGGWTRDSTVSVTSGNPAAPLTSTEFFRSADEAGERTHRISRTADTEATHETTVLENDASRTTTWTSTTPANTTVVRQSTTETLLPHPLVPGQTYATSTTLTLPGLAPVSFTSELEASWYEEEQLAELTATSRQSIDGTTATATSVWTRLTSGSATTGWELRVTSAEGRQSVTLFDVQGRPTWSAAVVPDDPGTTPTPIYAPSITTYDSRDRVTTVSRTASGVTRQVTNTYVNASAQDVGWVRQVSDEYGNEVSFTRDSLGRVITANVDGDVTEVGFDVGRQASSVTPPGRTAHTTSYSHFDDPQTYTPPLGRDTPGGANNVSSNLTWTPGTLAAGFDWGEVSGVDPAGLGSIGFTYEETGLRRLTRMNLTSPIDADVVLSYGDGFTDDAEVQSITMPQTGGLVSTVTTTLNRIGTLPVGTTTALPMGDRTVALTYDPARALWLDSISAHGTTVASYEYDLDGLPTEVLVRPSAPGVGLETLVLQHVDQTGQLQRVCLGGSAPISGACTGTAVTALSYSPGFGDLSGLDSTWGTSGGRLAFTYGYDLAGRISTIAETVNSTTTTRTYHYDSRGRLEAVTTPGPTTQYAYGYDANGNRTSWTSPSGSCSTSCTEVDAQDRLLRYGTTVFTYDAAGNLASRDLDGNPGTPADRTTYAYDELGHLRRVDLPGGAVRRYLIDGLGRRVGRYVGTATTATADRFWLYQDGLNPVAQLNAAGNLELLFVYRTMPHVPDAVVQVSTNTVFRVVTDHLGSVRRLVNVDTGAVAASYDYGPFGELQTSAPTVGSLAERFPFRFAGGLWDQDTGLIRFGARDYDPRLGRWTSKDPILWGGGQANLYEYARSNPSNLVDISGEHPIVWFVLIVASATGLTSDAADSQPAFYANDIADDVRNAARDHSTFGDDAHSSTSNPNIDTEQDAYRHCLWSCELAKKFGRGNAIFVTNFHEIELRGRASSRAMDRHNNRCGARLGASGAECAASCEQAVRSGDLSVTRAWGDPIEPLYTFWEPEFWK